jgi:3-hydroxyisobutyrate dehydrogenase-like beta-hydroxyacid dehydrogenase
VATVGILHPGEMGAAVGKGLLAAGHDVVWASDGRSAPTRERVTAHGFRDAGALTGVCAEAVVVVSVCPPEFALDLAGAVSERRFAGTYVDANAIAPSTAARVGELVGSGGAVYVDGGIIGGPGSPRLYLSGDAARSVAPLFRPPVDAVVLEGDPDGASAVKMLYAGWTKGTTALLLALGATAEHLGVADALQREWARSQPGLAERLASSGGSARKAWRWSGEMREIARTLEEAGLPDGFHAGAADVFARLASLKDAGAVTVEEMLRLLLER